MDLWTLLLELILTGIAFWLFIVVYAHVLKGPFPEPFLKWCILCIPVIILVLVVAAIWGLHIPDTGSHTLLVH